MKKPLSNFSFRLIIFLTSSLFFLISPHVSLAANYYVAPNGSDTNSGTQPSPWKTINNSVNKLKSGDKLMIRGGTYNERVTVSVSGTAAAPITISGYTNETIVIDGKNSLAPNFGALLSLNGSHIIITDLEIKNSAGMGVVLKGPNNKASRIKSHHNQENGILIQGDYGIVEDSEVYFNCYSNFTSTPSTGWSSGLTAARDPIDGHTDYAIIRRNKVYNNSGEGLSSYEATNTLIEDNIIYNSYSTNIYVSDSTNVLVQRNLVYYTPDTPVTRGSHVGIMMGDEKQKPASANNTIINNLVYGAKRNFYWWGGSFAGDGMKNDLVANNTFVNSTATTGVQINSGSHSNTKFINNIILQEGSLPSGTIASNIQTSNNLWSKAPNGGSGTGDIIGNPQLLRTGSTAMGQLTGDYFKLNSNSPAVNKAVVVSPVSVDFFKNQRGNSPDIGAHELNGIGGSSPTSSPSNPPSIQPSGTSNNTNIKLTLFLHGIGKGGDNVNPASLGTSNPLHPARNVTVDVRDGQNNNVLNLQGSVVYNSSAGNFQGSLNVDNLESGLYTVLVKSPQFLRKNLPGIIQITKGQTATLPTMSLINGDINNDNLLSVLDYNILLDCYADLSAPRNCSDTTKKNQSDLTDDGGVNQFDYNLFLRELSVQSGQ